MTTPREFADGVIRRITEEKEAAIAPLKQSRDDFRKAHGYNSDEITYELRRVSQSYNKRIGKFKVMIGGYENLMQMTDDELRLKSSNARFPTRSIYSSASLYALIEDMETILSDIGLPELVASIDLRREISKEVLERRLKEKDYKTFLSGRKGIIGLDPSSALFSYGKSKPGPRREERHARAALDIPDHPMVLPSQVSPDYRFQPNEDNYGEDSG